MIMGIKFTRWTVKRIWNQGTLELISSESILIKIRTTKTNEK
jgi:hypothetical protein